MIARAPVVVFAYVCVTQIKMPQHSYQIVCILCLYSWQTACSRFGHFSCCNVKMSPCLSRTEKNTHKSYVPTLNICNLCLFEYDRKRATLLTAIRNMEKTKEFYFTSLLFLPCSFIWYQHIQYLRHEKWLKLGISRLFILYVHLSLSHSEFQMIFRTSITLRLPFLCMFEQ